jgi:hypothetical protein
MRMSENKIPRRLFEPMLRQYLSVTKSKNGVFTEDQVILLKHAFGQIMRGLEWLHINMEEDLSHQRAILDLLDAKGLVTYSEHNEKFDEFETEALKRLHKKWPGESEATRDSQTLWSLAEYWCRLDRMLAKNCRLPETCEELSETDSRVSKGKRPRSRKVTP